MRTIVLGIMLCCASLAVAQKPGAPVVGKPAKSAVKLSSKLAAGAPGANLSWTAPTVGCSGGQSCTYNVYRGATSGSEALLTSGVVGTSYADGAVTRGNSYCYQVTAVNLVAESAKSNEACGTIPVGPGAPSGLAVTTQ